MTFNVSFRGFNENYFNFIDHWTIDKILLNSLSSTISRLSNFCLNWNGCDLTPQKSSLFKNFELFEIWKFVSRRRKRRSEFIFCLFCAPFVHWVELSDIVSIHYLVCFKKPLGNFLVNCFLPPSLQNWWIHQYLMYLTIGKLVVCFGE